MIGKEYNNIDIKDVEIILNVFVDVETIKKTVDGYFIELNNSGGSSSFDIKIKDNKITYIELKHAYSN